MKIEHDGFILEVEEVTDYDTGKRTHYRANCDRLPYFPCGLYKSDLEIIINRFKLAVKSQMKANEVEKETILDWSLIDKIKKEIMDQDAVLVNQFIAALDKVRKEMQEIDAKPNEELILRVKLNRVFEQYKDSLRLTDFESITEFYLKKFNEQPQIH